MSRLARILDEGRFLITCELNPPKGTRLARLLAAAERLRDLVDAFNLTDSHASHMAMSPLAVAHLMVDRGVEPIVQMTTRDRNRLALQADLLGAHALGVENVVVMGGDPPSTGDHPRAKPVFDLNAAGLLEAATALAGGRDLAGNALDGAPSFCLGAVVNPGADDLDSEIERMHQKRAAGARFFQSQAIYEPAAFERFMTRIGDFDAPILAGIIPVKSPHMARYMNERIPGIHVPDALVAELARAPDQVTAALEIAARLIKEVRPMCGGLHIMPIGWEDKVARLLEVAEAA